MDGLDDAFVLRVVSVLAALGSAGETEPEVYRLSADGETVERSTELALGHELCLPA
jgi:hypothetical protein